MITVVAWLLTAQALSPAIGHGAGMTVEGTSECPTPAQVATLLPGMLPQTGGDPQRELVSVDAIDGGLVVTVRGDDGSLLSSRTLADSGQPGACQALAAAVAVVIATWNIERSAEPSLLQEGLYRLQAPPRVVDRDVAAPAPPKWTGTILLLGAAVGTVVDRGGVAGTAGVEVEVRRRRLGWRLTLVADTERDRAQDGGTVTWRRSSAALGGVWRAGGGEVGVELAVQAFLGRVSADGVGFGMDRTDHLVAWGGDGALRVVGAGALQPFLEGTIRGWLSDQEVEVRASASSGSALPRVQGRVTVGVRCRFGDESSAR